MISSMDDGHFTQGVSAVTRWAECTVTGVSIGDVLTQIGASEDGAGAVVDPARRDAVVFGVDGVDAPAVAVAHRVSRRLASGGVEDRNGGVVAAADNQVPDRDALLPRDTDGGRLRVEGVMVDAVVERVGHFGCVAEQQSVLTGLDIDPVGDQGVGGHSDFVAGAQTVAGAVPVDRAAPARGPAVPQGEGRGALRGVVASATLPKASVSRAGRRRVGEHAAARLHRRQLMGVAHRNGLDVGLRCRGEFFIEVTGVLTRA